jgi:hypothetical protein
MFDRLVILTRGSPVYSGKASDCLAWFGRLGFELPAFVNPAEFLVDIAAIDNRSPELEAASLERVEKLKVAWLDESRILYRSDGKIGSEIVPKTMSLTRSAHVKHSPFIRQTRVLTARTFLTTWRDPIGMSGSLFEAVAVGIMTGWVFFGLSTTQSGIRSREGALYNAAALQGYLILIFETYRVSLPDVSRFYFR